MGGTLGAGQLVRVVISLAVVIGIMIVAARVLRRRGVGLGGGSGGRRPVGTAAIELLARRGLTRSTSIALVRIGDRHLVVGVTDASVSVLAEGGPETLGLMAAPLEAIEAIRTTPQVSPTRKTLLNAMRESTTRRV